LKATKSRFWHKRLKTPHSKRTTPVHPALIELGLLDHVERQRRKGEVRLFPEMKMIVSLGLV
jgi:hypothetical protein